MLSKVIDDNIDEDGEKAAIARGREHALGILDRVVLLDLPAEILAPDSLGIAHAVLPMQHQQRGVRRNPSGHVMPSRPRSPPKATRRHSALAKRQSEAKPGFQLRRELGGNKASNRAER